MQACYSNFYLIKWSWKMLEMLKTVDQLEKPKWAQLANHQKKVNASWLPKGRAAKGVKKTTVNLLNCPHDRKKKRFFNSLETLIKWINERDGHLHARVAPPKYKQSDKKQKTETRRTADRCDNARATSSTSWPNAQRLNEKKDNQFRKESEANTRELKNVKQQHVLLIWKVMKLCRRTQLNGCWRTKREREREKERKSVCLLVLVVR